MLNVFGRVDKDFYIPYIGKFLDEDVRLVLIDRKTYIVVKDMFRVLGRLRKDGQIEGNDKNRIEKVLFNLDQRTQMFKKKIYTNIDTPECGVDQTVANTGLCNVEKTHNTSKARKTQEMDLLNIELVPIVLIKFEPSVPRDKDLNKYKNYERKLDIYRKFMQWVNELIKDYHLEDYLIEDKHEQLRMQDRCEELGLDAAIVNKHVNINMAKLVGVYEQGIKELTKDDLRYYNNNTTMDLLLVRQEVMKDYLDLYLMFDSKELARKGSLNKAIDKYNVNINKEYKVREIK